MDIVLLPSLTALDHGLAEQEIAEAFEDPFNLRLVPDSGPFAHVSRSMCLGRTLAGKFLFCVFRSDGRRIQVLAARLMSPQEETFYQRHVQQWIS